MSEPSFTIHHNPACGTSRNTLTLLRYAGISLQVVEYLKTPPSRARLAELLALMGVSARELLRKKGTPYAELGLDNLALTEDQLLDAMEAHPILVERPIVIGPRGVKLCRPSDMALDLLATAPLADLDKEEGAPFLRDLPVSPEDSEFRAALQSAGLTLEGFAESSRCFLYRKLGGEAVGTGAFELHGDQALIRSVVVAEQQRGRGIGRNLLPILLARTREAGVRQAWLLTEGAEAFFEKSGFKSVPREAAPAEILSTRQATGLCSTRALLMTRKIGA